MPVLLNYSINKIGLSAIYGTFYSKKSREKKSASKIDFRIVISTLESTRKHVAWNFAVTIVLLDFSINNKGLNLKNNTFMSIIINLLLY